MARYIDAEEILKIIYDFKENCEHINYGTLLDINRTIRKLQTEDVAPIVHGKWLAEQEYTARNCRNYKYYKCSICGREVLTSGNPSEYFPYCNCGAKMEESVEEE